MPFAPASTPCSPRVDAACASSAATRSSTPPEFRREIEEPVAGAIAVLPTTRLVITEGNYLLLDEGPWAAVAGLLDDCWYVENDDALRRQRLVERHVRFGRSPQAARGWMEHTDEPNARRTAATRARA